MLGLGCFALVVGLTIGYGWWGDKQDWWCDKKEGNLWVAFIPPLVGIFSSLIIWLAYSGQWPIAMGYWGTAFWVAALATSAIVSLIINLVNNEVCEIDED